MSESAQKLMEQISGGTGTLQVLLNRAGGFSDQQYSVQGALNVAAGRSPHALSEQDALHANTGAPYGTFQSMMQWAKDQGFSKEQVVGGGPSLITWYASFWASDPLWTSPGADAEVTSWRDGSGNSRTLTGTAGTAPLYRSSVATLNSKPALEFDGTDNFLENPTSISITQPFSVVVICVPDTVGTTQRILGINNGNVNKALYTTSASAWGLNLSTAVTGGTPVADTAYMVRAIGTTTSTVHANETSVISGDAGTNPVNQLVVGTGRSATPTYQSYFDGWVAFVGYYSGTVTAAPNWTAFKSWVTSFYGITLA